MRESSTIRTSLPRRRRRRRSIQQHLKSAIDALAAANAAALDGGKKALAQKAHAKEIVMKLLEQLAVYVQANCKDDMTIFLSSGFTAVSSAEDGKTAGVRFDPQGRTG